MYFAEVLKFMPVLLANTKALSADQHKRRLYTWTSSEDQHQIQIDYIFVVRDGEALYSQKKQGRELTAAQIMNSLLPNSDSNSRK